ncbi:Wzz/FepE/Etk N-terminal domain-containing protein [Pseudomonas sp. SB113]|uniref:Wzz/FepE/Etk N-terminal domain-containing protein n=1 Tax=Pseudomonas sp. SB113 TaxID=3154123 RepID=UPI00345C7B59
MSSSFRAPPIRTSSETDLLALLRVVWLQKAVIALVTLSIGVLAAVYAFAAVPVYAVSSVLRPTAINELDALNRSGVYALLPKDALTMVGASLEAYDTRLGFFRANQKLFETFVRPGRTLEQSFEEFNRNSFTLILPDPKKPDALNAFVKVEMSYLKGVDGVAILNGFVNYAITLERAQIASDLGVIVKNRLVELDGKLAAARSTYFTKKEAEIALLAEKDSLRKEQLQDELRALRSELKTRRNDRVEQLSEAIHIARSLGIIKPSTPSSLSELALNGRSNVMRTEINTQQIPLYFMGVDALEAERSALMRRKSDDFSEGRIAEIAKELQLLQSNRQIEMLNRRQDEDLFLEGVEHIRAEAARLRNINVDMGLLKLVVIDKEALEPLSPVFPKKGLIIALGLILGFALGVMVTFVRSIILARCESGPGHFSYPEPVVAVEGENRRLE